MSDLAEQLDRIEAAVLSLADAFGSLQSQVTALQAAPAATKIMTATATAGKQERPAAQAAVPAPPAWEEAPEEPSSEA